MNKMKLHAKLIDLGVVDENAKVSVEEIVEHQVVYINVVNSLDCFQSYYYSYNKLTFIKGEEIQPQDVERMKTIDLEDFE